VFAAKPERRRTADREGHEARRPPPVGLLDDASLARAVGGAVNACFSSGGQLYIHVERLYVQSGIYDTFLRGLLEAIGAIELSRTPRCRP